MLLILRARNLKPVTFKDFIVLVLMLIVISFDDPLT